MSATPDATVEGPASWRAVALTTAIITVGFGAPYVSVVALKAIAADLGAPRSVPALANSLAYLGIGVGGIAMGWGADRVSVKWIALIGAVAVALGAALSSGGAVWQLYVGHGLLIGLLGDAALFPPMMTYVSRWFDRRRGLALSLVAGGQQLAGAFWPLVFGYAIERIGWQRTFLWYAAAAALLLVPLALLLRPPPRPVPVAASASPAPRARTRAGARSSDMLFVLLSAAIVCCCIPMAMPMVHLVAFCSDLGYGAARGTEMLSLLLGAALFSRVLWGRLSDRIGGLLTVLYGSLFQAIGLALFLVVRDLTALYVVSAALGFGFSGIIPAYVLAVREFFPAEGAGWRIGTLLFAGLAGMAFGGWLAGLLYDWAGYYGPAFAVGLGFNLANLAIVGALLPGRRRPAPLAAA